MANKNQCIQDYEKFLIDNNVRSQKFSKDEIIKLQEEFDARVKAAQTQGVDLDTVVDGKRVGDTLVDEEIKLQNKQDIADYISEGSDIQKTIHLKRDYQARVNSLIDEGNTPEKANKMALVSMIIDNYDTKGRSPLLELVKSEKTSLIGDMNALTLEHKDMPWFNFFRNKNKKDVDNFFRELIEIEKTKDITGPSVTGDVKVQAIARGYWQIKINKIGNRILTGDKSALNRINQKIVWNKKNVNKYTREQFVERHIDDLDTKVHGEDFTQRKEVLEKVYDDIQKGNWRIVGDKKQAGKTKKSLTRKSPVLTWKDGDTFLRVHKEYSRIGKLQQIITDIDQFGRENAVHQFFGSNPTYVQNWFRRMARKSGKESQIEYALDRMDAVLRPETYETNNAYAFIQTLKNAEVGSKLGSAQLMATIDIPVAILSGKGIFGLPLKELMKLSGSWGKLSLREEIRFAEEIGMIFPDMLGRMQDDLLSGATYGNKASNVIDKASRATMKYSYLESWTNYLTGAVAGICNRHIAKFVVAKTPFKDLPIKNQRMLAKYGIDDVNRGGQSNWQRLLDGDVVDDRGFINMRRLGELDSVFENAFGRTSLRNDLTTMFRDVADTLIIKGGDYDKAITNFFNDDRTVFGAVISALTQFKQIPVGIWRKQILRMWKDNGPVERLAFTAFMFGTMTAMGYIINDAKDFVKGRNPLKPGPEKFSRALITGGGFGIFSDIMMEFGGEELIKVLYGESKGNIKPQEFIYSLMGPVFSDMFKVMEGVGELGFAAITEARGEDGDIRGKLRPLSKTVIEMIPFQNMWWASMVVRKYVNEYVQEWVDPDGFAERERRFERRAMDTRKNGEYDNIIYQSLGD